MYSIFWTVRSPCFIRKQVSRLQRLVDIDGEANVGPAEQVVLFVIKKGKFFLSWENSVRKQKLSVNYTHITLLTRFLF